MMHVTIETKTFFCVLKTVQADFLTHISVLVSILQTQNTLPVITNTWRRRELWAVFTI